jgi:hypothetical protein
MQELDILNKSSIELQNDYNKQYYPTFNYNYYQIFKN